MTDQELRALVREAIAQQLGHNRRTEAEMVPAAFLKNHLSHAQFAVPSGPEGTCIIEPTVMCNHCGYCKSYGH